MRVLFFARLREQLGKSSLELADWQGGSVAELRDRLIAAGGSVWAEALGDDNVIVAVNQNVASADTPVNRGDEVAFFPPVTGG